MLQKGSMINAKKIMGVGLLAIGVGSLMNIEQITSIIAQNKMIVHLLVAVSGYFLFISGRQR